MKSIRKFMKLNLILILGPALPKSKLNRFMKLNSWPSAAKKTTLK